MTQRFRLLLLLLFLASFSLATYASLQDRSNLKRIILQGKIYNASTKEPLGWATVEIQETGIGVVCDAEGHYTLSVQQAGEYTVVVRCVGFSPFSQKVLLTENKTLNISLHELSIELAEVEVLGAYKKNKSEVVVGQEALQHIQPVSIKDILILLPGAVMDSPDVGEFK